MSAFASGSDWLTSHSLSKGLIAHSSTSPLSSLMLYELCYFVEGTNALGVVTIPYQKSIFALKGEIIQQLSNTYCNGVDAWQLETLKVCYLRIFSCCFNQHYYNFI